MRQTKTDIVSLCKKILAKWKVFTSAAILFIFAMYFTLNVHSPTAYRVIASTGVLEAQVVSKAMPNSIAAFSWAIHDALICSGIDTAFSISRENESTTCAYELKSFTGTLSILPNTTIKVLRNRKSNVVVEISQASNAEKTAIAYIDYGFQKIDLHSPLKLSFQMRDDILETTSILSIVAKSITIGKDIVPQSVISHLALSHGEVTMAQKSWVGGQSYIAGAVPLSFGDRVLIEALNTNNDVVATIGKDIKAGLIIGVSASEGAKVSLYRFLNDGVDIAVPYYNRLINDPTLVVVWAIVIFLYGLATRRFSE